jgi:hypothetical protein
MIVGVCTASLVGMVACNLINGSHDRFLDPETENAGGALSDRRIGEGSILQPEGGGGGLEDGPTSNIDGGGGGNDATSPPIKVDTKTWFSPNGASVVIDDAGTRIVGYTDPNTHPIIVPANQPNIPSEDYTVHAVIRATAEGEFGILARIQGNGAAVLLSSRFGAELNPWVGDIGPATGWNPARSGMGPAYTFVPNTRYRFWLRVRGRTVEGKMWDALQAMPINPQATWTQSPFMTGKGVGYYTYGIAQATLESIEVTVP